MSKKDNKEEQLQAFIDRALSNVELDRGKADFLLRDVMVEMEKRKSEYKDLGPVAAKYLESLTRCNEQLVRLVTILKPKTKEQNEEELTNEDRNMLFEALQSDDNNKTTSEKKKSKKEKN